MKLFSNVKGDIFGGVTAGIVALPLALAFGIQAFSGIDDPSAASIGAYAGLVGATLLGFFAALFGIDINFLDDVNPIDVEKNPLTRSAICVR